MDTSMGDLQEIILKEEREFHHQTRHLLPKRLPRHLSRQEVDATVETLELALSLAKEADSLDLAAMLTGNSPPVMMEDEGDTTGPPMESSSVLVVEQQAISSGMNGLQTPLQLPQCSSWGSFAYNLRRLSSQVHKKDAATDKMEIQASSYSVLEEKDMDVFGYTPGMDPLLLVKCIHCSKIIKASRFTAHLDICNPHVEPRKFELPNGAQLTLRLTPPNKIPPAATTGAIPVQATSGRKRATQTQAKSSPVVPKSEPGMVTVNGASGPMFVSLASISPPIDMMTTTKTGATKRTKADRSEKKERKKKRTEAKDAQTAQLAAAQIPHKAVVKKEGTQTSEKKKGMKLASVIELQMDLDLDKTAKRVTQKPKEQRPVKQPVKSSPNKLLNGADSPQVKTALDSRVYSNGNTPVNSVQNGQVKPGANPQQAQQAHLQATAARSPQSPGKKKEKKPTMKKKKKTDSSPHTTRPTPQQQQLYQQQYQYQQQLMAAMNPQWVNQQSQYQQQMQQQLQQLQSQLSPAQFQQYQAMHAQSLRQIQQLQKQQQQQQMQQQQQQMQQQQQQLHHQQQQLRLQAQTMQAGQQGSQMQQVQSLSHGPSYQSHDMQLQQLQQPQLQQLLQQLQALQQMQHASVQSVPFSNYDPQKGMYLASNSNMMQGQPDGNTGAQLHYQPQQMYSPPNGNMSGTMSGTMSGNMSGNMSGQYSGPAISYQGSTDILQQHYVQSDGTEWQGTPAGSSTQGFPIANQATSFM